MLAYAAYGAVPAPATEIFSDEFSGISRGMMSAIHRRAILLLLAGSLLIGLAQAALLPPFEGFDEAPHYSYIQQLAQTGQWPLRGDRMSREFASSP